MSFLYGMYLVMLGKTGHLDKNLHDMPHTAQRTLLSNNIVSEKNYTGFFCTLCYHTQHCT